MEAVHCFTGVHGLKGLAGTPNLSLWLANEMQRVEQHQAKYGISFSKLEVFPVLRTNGSVHSAVQIISIASQRQVA
jgi:hypothetical protein